MDTKILRIILCLLYINASLSAFTCQGDSYANSLSSCPDKGAQKYSSGGNVTVLVKRAKNLPDRDIFGENSAVSDPYVQFIVGDAIRRQTSPVRNDLNPVWNEYVSLGLLGSATEIRVKIWDYDIGLEGFDDLLISNRMRVPFCSTFHANTSEVLCGKPFGCKSDDSLWKMPVRQVCHESGALNMKTGQIDVGCDAGGSICLELEFFIVPYTMGIERINEDIVDRTPQLGCAGNLVPSVRWTVDNRFSFPYLSDITTRFRFTTDQYKHLEGALMIRTADADRYKGQEDEIYFYASVNFPTYLYICRMTDDNANGMPKWMRREYNHRNLTTTQFILADEDETYDCIYQLVDGTNKNKWGGITGGELTFKTNVIEGHTNGVAEADFYTHNYVVIALPRVEAKQEEDLAVEYTAGPFWTQLASYGFIWAWFMYVAVRFLKRIKFRTDRVMTFLTTRVFTGDSKNILATLFVACYGQSPSNIEFRSHLYHATNSIYFLLIVPHLLLIGLGCVVIATTQPVSLGYAIIFIGMAAINGWFGFRLWELQKWRVTDLSMIAMSSSAILFLCFMISVIFVDPAVIRYGHALNISALSMIFGTINTMPLLLLIFQRDKAYKINLNIVVEKMTEAVMKIKEDQDGVAKRPSKALTINTALHALLGDCYTLNPRVPLFKFASVLLDNVKGSAKEKSKRGNTLYNVSLFILFVYLMIAVSRTDFPGVAFLHCLALILLDSIHTALSHGTVKWSSGFHIFLLVAGRIFIMSSSGNLWLLNYSIAYLIYAFALIKEIINKYLPHLTKQQAGEAAFAGKDSTENVRHPDIAGSPMFCLGFLTFTFVGLLLVAAFSRPDNLPIAEVEVWGALWYSYVFGLIAFLVVVVGGLLTATARAFYLQKHGLLRDWARDSYVFHPKYNVPVMLAIFSEIAVIASGILIYGATGSSAILTTAIFLPPILLCLGYAYKVWVANDYDLIIWPPVEKKPDRVDDAPTELEVAFHMMENLFGADGNPVNEENPETDGDDGPVRTLKGFQLPSMEPTDAKAEAIKMPALPLKSVLRKKRQALGVATTGTPLVDDLRARDGADADKFGAGDVLDANDPWARFGEDEEDEEDDGKGKKGTNQRDPNQRRSIFDNPVLVKIKELWMGTKAGRWICFQISVCLKFIKKRANSYMKVEPTDEEEEDVNIYDAEKQAGEEGEEPTEATPALPKETPLAEMDFWVAAANGYLTRDEYFTLWAWFGGMLLIMIYGIILAKTVTPHFIGHLIWVSVWMFICTTVPIVKYFNTYVIDDTIKYFAYFMALFHFIFCLTFFLTHLDGDVGIVGSLWILDFFFYYPIFVYMFIEAYKWRDDNWVIMPLDQDGDGNVTWMEYAVFFKAYPVIVSMMILLVWQAFSWIGNVTGGVVLLTFLVGITGYLFARDWAVNDFFLSVEMSMYGDLLIKFILLIFFLISIFSSVNPVFYLSVFFFTLIFRCCTKIVSRAMIAEADEILYLSPFVMPVYTYDSQHNDIIDESHVAKQVIYALLAGAMWGAFLAMFLYPVSVGVLVACVFLLIIAAIVASAVSYVPLQLGRLASMLQPEALSEAANAAVERYHERKQPLQIQLSEWDDSLMDMRKKEAQEKAEEIPPPTAIAVASEIMDDTKALRYVRDDSRAKSVHLEDEDEFDEIPWYKKYYREAKAKFWEWKEKLMPTKKHNRGWKVHSEALFTAADIVPEAVITGRGPFGFFGLEGTWYKLFKMAQEHRKLKFLRQPWLNLYDQYGNKSNVAKLTEMLDINSILRRLGEQDDVLDECAFEESRCGVHFLLMTLVSADARLHREQILFQKFLRENRYRLASNGISPPAEIFTSSSYASIDVPLVAVWLSTLTSEERERFHLLKATFSEEQALRDEAIDNEDFKLDFQAKALRKERSYRDEEMVIKTKREITLRQADRIRALVDSLTPVEKSAFLMNREEWTSNADCYVHPDDEALYEKFRAAVMHSSDETTEYARQVLAEIEAARKDCRIGEYGRTYQFVDSEFLPGDLSLGQIAEREMVGGWRCAPGICDTVQLFDTGTDPDDVEIGVVKSSWLLSAISMLAAAGGVGDGGIDEQVLNLFVGHYAIDGEITFHTEVGAYCIRLYKGGMWMPIIVDDNFPLLRDDKWTNENKGIACAHSKEVNEIWVSVIEKVFAKYYGSYAAIEKGYVHHALEDMTGCEAECISLNSASRGPQKRVLWDKLVRFRKNGYILGAGTGSSSLADKEILEMGIVFDAAYTIYDVKSVDGHYLIKLRNPPGDHEEWRGDWSDESSLWTKRLKHKLNWTNADDNTFWMSFDDFCNVFRSLYVCKWYNRDRWHEISLPGKWLCAANQNKLGDRPAPKRDQLDSMYDDDNYAAAAALPPMPDTAGGLPSIHNPGCILENNPFYALKIYRPTDIRLTLSQADSRGVAQGEVHHAAVYICKSPHPKVPLRMKSLKREDVIAYSGEAKKERTQHLYATLKPGTYVVLVATYIAGKEGNFTLSLLSNSKAKLTAIWPPSWLVPGQSLGKYDGLTAGNEIQTESKLVQDIFNRLQKGITALLGTAAVGKDGEEEEDEEEEDGEKEEVPQGEEAV